MSNTIYDNKIWPRILEKHPDLKELAIQLGVENNPEKAKKIKQKVFRNPIGSTQYTETTKTEKDLAIQLSAVEFVEQNLLNEIVAKGIFANRVGEYEDASVAFDLVLMDFDWTFTDFIETCKRKNEDIENISFSKAYEIFLEVIQLKLEYKIPYTKLFIKKLLEMSQSKEKDLLEIKSYFLKNDPSILKTISQELQITDL